MLLLKQLQLQAWSVCNAVWVSSSAETSDIEQLIGLWSTGVVRVKRVSCSVKSSCATLSRWNQQRIWTSETYAKGTREPGSFYKMGMMLQSCCNCNQHYNYYHGNTNYGNSYLISFKLNKNIHIYRKYAPSVHCSAFMRLAVPITLNHPHLHLSATPPSQMYK